MKPICIIPIYSQMSNYPYKHALYLSGQPLFHHAIDKAHQSQLFSDIIIITNDPVYAEIAKEKEVRIEFYQGQAKTEIQLIHDMISQVLCQYSDEQDFMLLNATAILLQIEQLQESYHLYCQYHKQTILSMVQLPSQMTQLFQVQKNDDMILSYTTERLYYPIHALAISYKAQHAATRSFISPMTKAYILPQDKALLIENHQDFVHILGENYLNYQVREKNGKAMFYQLYDEKLEQPSQNKVLLGDSRTVNIQLSGFKNFGIGGVTLTTLMEKIQDILTSDVKLALVSIGVNDFTTKYSFETIQQNFKDLIAICQRKKIRLLLTTIPYTLYRHEVSNAPIHKMNQWLEAYCLDRKIPLLDLNQLLSHKGMLKYKYTYDGLHFTDEANNLITQQYKQFIQQYS